jgi:putative ABC transport system permease protein
MKVSSVLRVSFQALFRHKLRSTLTVLGVVIGVAAVIAMVSLGQGAEKSLNDLIVQSGVNVVFVSPFLTTRGGVRGWGGAQVTTLVEDDANAIAKDCPSVAAVSPLVRTVAQVIAGNANWSTSIEGVGEKYGEIRSWSIAQGDFFPARDIRRAAKVCVLGKTVAESLFGRANPVGETIRIKNVPFQVVGVLAEKGQGTYGENRDDVVLAPFTTIQKKLLGITYLHRVFVAARGPAQVESASREITDLLVQRHRIRPGQENDFSVGTMAEMVSTARTQTETMGLLLLAIASVSLLVGGIGIMNIMYVSVTERTREIGIRMAVGARGRDVLGQFLIEAVVLSLSGGVLGIALGVGASLLIPKLLRWPATISPEAVLVSFLFSGAVGIFFGFYPARRASRLDPIEALRYE